MVRSENVPVLRSAEFKIERMAMGYPFYATHREQKKSPIELSRISVQVSAAGLPIEET